MGFTQPDSPSSPENFAGVATQGMNIQAPVALAEVTAATEAATAIWAVNGPRQQQAQAMMDSPAGFGLGGWDVDAGYHGYAGDGWPSNVEPGG